MPLFDIDGTPATSPFPSAELALEQPDGLLAIGGDLSTERLLTAYSNGIFPWYNEGEDILWWSPRTRACLTPEKAHLSKSSRKIARKHGFSATTNKDFKRVISLCATAHGTTWISEEMAQAYITLNQAGWAHSVEIWSNGELTGGLYGVCIYPFFFGESMFSLCSGASKYGFYHLNQHLKRHNFKLLDCQLVTDHLRSMGAESYHRSDFLKILSDTKLKTSAYRGWGDNWEEHVL